MRSQVLLLARPGRGPHIECSGGLAARRTGSDTVHLLSAAATPLGGDVISVRVIVESGARLKVRTVAATLVLPGADCTESHSCWDLEVDGELDVDPQPTVVAADARHHTRTTVRVGESGSARVRESAQIGRTGEHHGFWTSTLYADVADRPLLRHRVELGAGSVADDELGTPLACVSELRYPETTFDGAGVLLKLAGGGSLSTWQGRRLGG